MSFFTNRMEFEKSSIERLKRTLYSRNDVIIPKEKRTPVAEREIDVPKDWGTAPSFDISAEAMAKKNNSFFNRFLLISLVFFCISLGVAVFIFFGGLNMISSNNLDIKIVAPSSVSSGEDLLIGLTVVNGNRTDLEDTTLFVEYPEGSMEVGNSNKILSREKVNLGIIPRGQSKDHSIRALLFGEKDVVKTFNLRIEYKVKGSNAVFSKEKKLDIAISSSPLLLNVLYPKEVNSGQEINFTVQITSNSSVVISDSLIKIEYPYGFTYKSSNIRPVRDNSLWNIGDLKNGDQKTLSITGVLVGQNMEDRSFRISAGKSTPDNRTDFDTVLAESAITIGIRKSFFDLKIAEGDSHVAVSGQSIPITIEWQNTLPDKVVNSRIEAKVSGSGLDRSSVTVGNGGFYRSLDDTVLWDKNTTDKLVEMLPGAEGQVFMSLNSFKNKPQSGLIKNPHIDLHVVMTGDRSGLDAGEVSSSGDVTIKIVSELDVSVKTLRNSGPFVNTGPIPPVADKESTYTITWTLTNTSNDLKDTVVSAVLPQGVVWKGEILPISEKIGYNIDTRTVTWNVGGVLAGTGFTYSPKEVSFKLGIIPSLTQVGFVANLISATNAQATDTYTDTQIQVSEASITTQATEPGFKSGDGVVQK